MGRLSRGLFTVGVLLVVWTFRGTRAAALTAVIGVACLRRTYVTKPARTGTLGRRVGAPRWVRFATGRVAGAGLARHQAHTGDLFRVGRTGPPLVERWW